MARTPPYPFIKWLGGKNRVSPYVLRRLPEKCSTYYEPMVGGGAVFIKMAKEGRFKSAVISDMNDELICAWRLIKSDVGSLIKELRKKKYKYDKEIYLKIRTEDPNEMDDVRKAARFIYLNRTGFNGLYRVNSKGKFNVPFGKYTDPTICDAPNLKALSELLKNVEIYKSDFETHASHALGGDAVYFDPPYIPISDTSNFDKYTAGGFNVQDHERLARLFDSLSEIGVRVVISNSSSEKSLELYGQFDIDWLDGTRSIGGPAEYRHSVKEIIAFAGPKM